MATRTAKGTTSGKVSSTTLILEDVECSYGESLIVGIGFNGNSYPDSVVWGSKVLVKVVGTINDGAVPNHGCALYMLRSVGTSNIANIVITWTVPQSGKVMFASTLDIVSVWDVYTSSIPNATSSPSVGPTGAISVDDGFGFGILAPEGPSTDTSPTLSGGWTIGQKVGTIGSPDDSNKTIIECYKQLSSYSAETLSGTGATQRDWSNVILAVRETVIVPAIDSYGSEIIVGDTVKIVDAPGISTVVSFQRTLGNPLVKCVLADGRVINAYVLEVIE